MKTVKHENSEQTALPTETFLNYNKLRARRIPDHAIELKSSVDIIEAFFTQITASISSDTLKHITGVSGKRSTPAPEIVARRKNNFAIPSPFRPWASLNLLLVWSSLAVFLFYF